MRPSPLGLVFALLTVGGVARAADAPCREPPGVDVWWSPEVPVAGERLRVMVVSAQKRDGEIAIRAGGRPRQTLATTRRGGPPFSFTAELPAAPAGSVEVQLASGGDVVACRRVQVAKRRPAPRALGAKVWPTTRAWDRAVEDYYAAWIEALFDAPPDESFSHPSLAPVLRDPTRNFLHGHLRLGEDDPKNRAVPKAEPDCADLPYYLRAYFAWKLGLPFGFRDCDRGTSDRPPRCGPLVVHNEQPPSGKDSLGAFRQFLRQLANKVHSGSGRTALADEQTDHYPLPLTREALRPGVIYADPYGHVLMIVKWVDQDKGRGGRLFAVDGQPDNSVGRKRFWEGTFLFASDTKSAGPGFKAFRPLVSGEGGPQPLGNAALAGDRRFTPIASDQAALAREAFYTRMAALINPQGLDAAAAYEETLNALVEQIETRVGSVDAGEKHMRESNFAVVAMPEGPKIFETVGPWEDYATPSRDMRLIIAMNVLLGLADRITSHPDLFVLKGRKPADVRSEVLKLHEKRIRERAIEYTRSDGSKFKLTVADILARKPAFEIAYNPNDCAEVRWGASEGTADFASCKRRAPADQQARMSQYRTWFREARRPPR